MTKSDILLLLLASPGTGSSSGIVGTTRLQKLLFLIENEAKIKADEGRDFDFTAYKFGPVSKDLYDDLAKLENLGFIESQSVAEPTPMELDEFGLSFEGLMGDEKRESLDVFEERKYSITEKGRRWLADRNLDTDKVEQIRRIKGRYGSLSLNDLLHHVYSRFPKMTTASEIREKILGV